MEAPAQPWRQVAASHALLPDLQHLAALLNCRRVPAAPSNCSPAPPADSYLPCAAACPLIPAATWPLSTSLLLATVTTASLLSRLCSSIHDMLFASETCSQKSIERLKKQLQVCCHVGRPTGTTACSSNILTTLASVEQGLSPDCTQLLLPAAVALHRASLSLQLHAAWKANMAALPVDPGNLEPRLDLAGPASMQIRMPRAGQQGASRAGARCECPFSDQNRSRTGSRHRSCNTGSQRCKARGSGGHQQLGQGS